MIVALWVIAVCEIIALWVIIICEVIRMAQGSFGQWISYKRDCKRHGKDVANEIWRRMR